MAAVIAECRFQLGFGGIPQVDDVFGVKSQHIDHESQKSIGVVVGEIHLGQPTLVGLIADDDGDAGGVCDFRKCRDGGHRESNDNRSRCVDGTEPPPNRHATASHAMSSEILAIVAV